MKVIDARWLLASLVAAVVAITGCGTSGETEGKGSSTQKILTPVASIQTPASKETRAAFGIVEWKIFRSKSDLHMTGYDANGKAVKGITTGFAKSANGGDTELRTKINDGSKFKALHNFRAKTNKATSKTLATDSAAFVNAAMTDAGKIHTLFKAKAKTAAKAPTAAATSAQCGADLSGIMSKALQCMQGKANTKAQQAACIAAAKTAAASSSSCKSTGATTPAPAKASAPKSSGAAKKSSNSSAKKSSGSKGSTAKKDSTKKTDDAKDDDYVWPASRNPWFQWLEAYVEGNAWHYVWYVPYDVDAMIDVQHSGDRLAFIARMEDYWYDGVFEEPDDKLPDDWYWHGNEPVMHYAFLGSLAGAPDLTADASRWIMANRYKANDTGLDGNDDSGTLSAWYLLAASGFFPIAGTTNYAVASPLFERLEIDRPDGTQWVVRAQDTSDERRYVGGLSIGESEIGTSVVNHAKDMPPRII